MSVVPSLFRSPIAATLSPKYARVNNAGPLGVLPFISAIFRMVLFSCINKIKTAPLLWPIELSVGSPTIKSVIPSLSISAKSKDLPKKLSYCVDCSIMFVPLNSLMVLMEPLVCKSMA